MSDKLQFSNGGSTAVATYLTRPARFHAQNWREAEKAQPASRVSAAAALALTRLIVTLLYGVTATDLVTFDTAAATLAAVATCPGGPTWRSDKHRHANRANFRGLIPRPPLGCRCAGASPIANWIHPTSLVAS
jgi:hypothetical protein